MERDSGKSTNIPTERHAEEQPLIAQRYRMNGASGNRAGHRPETGVDRTARRVINRVAGIVTGRSFTAAQREMERAQWLPREELQARMDARLAPLLQHAAEHVPFYRELYRQGGLAPDALRTVADLQRVPIVSKATHRQHPPDFFLADNLPPHRRRMDRTSGSTGEPFRFFVDRAAAPVVLASHLFYDSWFGIRPYDRNVRIQRPGIRVSALPPGMPAFYRLRQETIARLKALYELRTQRRISIWEVDADTAESVYRRIEAFRPAFIHGYASTLANLAEELLRRDLRLTHPVRGVMNIAETLTPLRRRQIERYFDAPIINRYGLREIGPFFAQSCPENPEQFHVNTERVVWETVRADGTPAAPGEIGRVVLTALQNYVMPFIRYDTGDLAAAGDGPCACGRGLPLVGPIDGRSAECLRTPSGRLISPVMLAGYLVLHHDHVDTVRQYQLVVEGSEQVRLLIVPAPQLTDPQRERLRQEMARILREFLGGEMQVAVEQVAGIPPEKSGKRLVIKQGAAIRSGKPVAGR